MAWTPTVKIDKKKSTTTNDKMLKALLKEIDGTIYPALLRERIVCIMEQTVQQIKDDPQSFANPIVHPKYYLQLNEIVQYYLGFEE